MRKGLASARRILAKAAELFDRSGGTARPTSTLAAFLQQEWDSRMDSAAEAISQGDIDEVLDQGVQALIAAVARGKWKARSSAGDIDFRLESPTGQIDVSLCNQRNMNSLAARLRRLGRARPEWTHRQAGVAARSAPRDRQDCTRHAGLPRRLVARRARASCTHPSRRCRRSKPFARCSPTPVRAI